MESNQTMNIEQFIIDWNKKQSAEFCSPNAQNERRLYRSRHKTKIIVFKCMDGRLNLALYTNTPPGIMDPFRNIGGKFEPGWPFFQECLRDSVHFGLSDGREVILITSYHFSKGDHHRNCAGHGYNTDKAKQSAFVFRDKLRLVFGDSVVYPITIGIETDEEALIFHGNNGKVLEVASLPETISESEVRQSLETLYPDLRVSMVRDLVPLVLGNVSHIREIHVTNKTPVDLEHCEQIIAVGPGFDWLHLYNKALIIGPYSLNWPEIVKMAGGIVLGNLRAGRIKEEEGVLLLVNALFRKEEKTSGLLLREEMARYMLELSEKILREEVPELGKHLRVLAGVTHADTREFKLLT